MTSRRGASLLQVFRVARARAVMHVLVATLFLVKAAVSIYDVVSYSPKNQHDYFWHSGRTLVAGLVAGKMDYDPPLYYLLAWPAEHWFGMSAKDPVPLMRILQYTNLFYLFLFYWLTIYVIFPRLVANYRHWALASVLLLGLPGFQRLVVMVHCDNIFIATCAGSLGYWLARRHDRRFGSAVVLALLAGLTGLTRPLAIGPVFLFWILAMRGTVRASQGSDGKLVVPRFVARAALISAMIGVMSGSWYVYRWKNSGDVLNAYKTDYIAPFQKYKKGFPWGHYFGSFYLPELLSKPNRSLFDLDKHAKGGRNKYANSFFTLAYSELWGDQWLYFTGHQGRGETRFEEKRRLLVAALPLTLLFLIGLARGVGAAVLRAVRTRALFSPQLVASALAVGGLFTYFWWQTGPALLPGKNSTIKFIYVAFLVPSFLGLTLWKKLPNKAIWALGAYALAIFALALPISIWRAAPEAKIDQPSVDEAPPTDTSAPATSAKPDR